MVGGGVCRVIFLSNLNRCVEVLTILPFPWSIFFICIYYTSVGEPSPMEVVVFSQRMASTDTDMFLMCERANSHRLWLLTGVEGEKYPTKVYFISHFV